MNDYHLIKYWEKKYHKLQGQALFFTFFGTLAGCVVGNYTANDSNREKILKVFSDKVELFLSNSADTSGKSRPPKLTFDLTKK